MKEIIDLSLTSDERMFDLRMMINGYLPNGYSFFDCVSIIGSCLDDFSKE